MWVCVKLSTLNTSFNSIQFIYFPSLNNIKKYAYIGPTQKDGGGTTR